MSRLIEKIKKQAQTAPPPMGFRTSRQVETTPKILIIAGVKIDAAGSAIKNIEGADAMLLSGNNTQLSVKALAKSAKALKDMPWGVLLEDCGDKTEALEETGCDFVVLSPTCPVTTMPQDEKTGKILQVESSMDDGLLRAVNDLPADAVLAADTFGEGGALVWHHLMILRHLAAMVVKPLIVPVPAAITEAELKALWDAGIEAVLVPVDISKDEDLKALHEAAARLPSRSALKRGKMDVILPRAGGETAPPPDEEEEEDE